MKSIQDQVIDLSAKADTIILAKCEDRKVDGKFKSRLHPDRLISLPIGALSAFEGGTLRPLESLEDILFEESPNSIWVVGTSFSLVVQTALDANALGYRTFVFQNLYSDMGVLEEAIGLKTLDIAGVQVV